MKNAVMIKSFPNGLMVLLDEKMEFPELLKEVALKFKESQHFFSGAKMALSLEGRMLSEQEEKQVVDTIIANSSLNIVCLVGKDEETNQAFFKAVEQAENLQKDNDGQFYRGTLRNGQLLETEKSIVVIGDVHPGASIISHKDIIVLGGLYGEAYAGGNGEEGHFVVALEMSPQKLKVGDFKYISTEKSRWSIRPKVQPKIAYVKNGRVIVEPLTKESLN
ncbi:MAG: septum site-determining protein MinC [Clostridiales bacterium]|nr:septum site-determining protein MinC [Clostridiales bacterium]